MTCLVSKICFFQVQSMVQSNFAMSWVKEVTSILSRSMCKGLGTPEVKKALIPVSAFIKNKVASKITVMLTITLYILTLQVTASSLELSAVVNYVLSEQVYSTK